MPLEGPGESEPGGGGGGDAQGTTWPSSGPSSAQSNSVSGYSMHAPGHYEIWKYCQILAKCLLKYYRISECRMLKIKFPFASCKGDIGQKSRGQAQRVYTHGTPGWYSLGSRSELTVPQCVQCYADSGSPARRQPAFAVTQQPAVVPAGLSSDRGQQRERSSSQICSLSISASICLALKWCLLVAQQLRGWLRSPSLHAVSSMSPALVAHIHSRHLQQVHFTSYV